MADSLFLEPMKRWFQNKLNRQPSGREADLTVGGIDSSDQLRNILAEHRAAGTSPAVGLAPSQAFTTDPGGSNTQVCPQCDESYDAGSQFCAKCGCGLSLIDPSLPPVESSSDGGVTRVRLENTAGGPSPDGAITQVRLGGAPEGQIEGGVNVSNVTGEQRHVPDGTDESNSEEAVTEAGGLLAPEPVDSMTSNLRSLFTRTSVVNQETKDLLERYGTVDIRVLVAELDDLAGMIGARRRRVR